MSWTYEGGAFDEVLIDKNVGFVYVIENKTNGRRYIGKKLFFFSRTKVVKGKKKRLKVPSDWLTYWSSSVELQADVATLGEDCFTREVLHLCGNKGSMSYLEAKLQFKHEVLEHPELWYNGIINCKIHRSHVKI